MKRIIKEDIPVLIGNIVGDALDVIVNKFSSEKWIYDAKKLKLKILSKNKVLRKIQKLNFTKKRKLKEWEGYAKDFALIVFPLADSMEMLNQASPNDQVIKLKALEAMQKVADGQATKIIIPSEMQGLVGLSTGLVEGAKK